MKKLISLVLCLTLLGLVSCSTPSTDGKSQPTSAPSSATPSATPSDTSSSAVEDLPTDSDDKLNLVPVWQQVPFISKEIRDAGYNYGEGCEAMPTITYAPSNGNLLFFGSDVGAIYKSVDGGESWAPCTFGYEACGATCIAVDPNNADRVLAVGCNSGYHTANGIYLSENGGELWSRRFAPGSIGFDGRIGIHNDYNRQLAFDKNSYDEKIKGSAVVYWSRENYTTHAKSNQYNHPAIYKSVDGGKTWKELADSAKAAGGEITVDNRTGNVIAVNSKGAWVSTDGGKTWRNTYESGFDCVYSHAGKAGKKIWACNKISVFESSDGGLSWKGVSRLALEVGERIISLTVSPADDKRIALTWVGSDAAYRYKLMVTHDGGKSWSAATRNVKYNMVPANSWKSVMCWHPTDKNVIIANGPLKSTNGGKSFEIAKTGFTGLCVGGKITPNVNDNRLIAIGIQDFNGGYTLDSGYTWTYVNWSGKHWGGHTYGAYMIDSDSIVTSLADGWGETRYLAYTHDGGKNIVRTEYVVAGEKTGYGVVGDENIIFFGEYRSADKGQSWSKMIGCTAVFTHSPKTGRLFGANNKTLVFSDDKGVTWKYLCVTDDAVTGIAYNSKNDTVYFTTSKGLHTVANGNDKQATLTNGEFTYARGIVADPKNQNILYLCRAWQGPTYNFDSVFRSLDGGKTWSCLNRQYGDGREGPDGGRQAGTMAFNSVTREVLVYSGCRGMWKIKACDPSAGK